MGEPVAETTTSWRTTAGLKNNIRLVAISRPGIKAFSDDLLEGARGGQDIKTSGSARGQPIRPIRLGNYSGDNFSILKQGHAGVGDRSAQKIGDRSIHHGGAHGRQQDRKQRGKERKLCKQPLPGP